MKTLNPVAVALGTLVDSQAVIGNPLLTLRKMNLGPRIGFAWDPQGNGRKFFPSGLQRRNPAWGEIRYKDFNGDSYYNGLQLKVTQRMMHGLQAQTSYTFARSVDTASVANGIPTQDPDDIRAERSLSDFDVRHLFNRANFAQPSGVVFQAATGVPSRSAGRIRQTVATSRQIQLGLKVIF